jgi:hypothetical protein
MKKNGSQDVTSKALLSGVAFAILLVASFAVIGSPPSADDSTQAVVTFYSERESDATSSAMLSALSAVLFLFFVGSLATVLEASEGATAGLVAVARTGGAVAAVGILIFAGVAFTLGDAAATLEPAAVQTLNALNDDLFFPLLGGMVTFFAATGLVMVRSQTLPRWLGWAALGIAVVLFTPLGVSSFLAAVAWVVIASIVLFARADSFPARPVRAGAAA